VEIKVPRLPTLNVGSHVLKALSADLSKHTARGKHYFLHTVATNPMSLKLLMSNSKSWCSDLDRNPIPCMCRQLRRVLGVPPPADGEHIVAKFSDTKFAKSLPPRFSADTSILPSLRSTVKDVQKAIQYVLLKTNCEFDPDTSALYNTIARWYKKNEKRFVSANLVNAWIAAVTECGVITAVDKMQCELAISCPMKHHQRVFEMFVWQKSITWCFDSDAITAEFFELKRKLLYSNIPVNIAKHKFGSAGAIPKASNLQLKSRPIGSYFHHAAKRALSCACKILVFSLHAIGKLQGREFIVDSVARVRAAFDD